MVWLILNYDEIGTKYKKIKTSRERDFSMLLNASHSITPFISIIDECKTYSKLVNRKTFLQKLNQGALADTGRATNDYGATAFAFLIR